MIGQCRCLERLEPDIFVTLTNIENDLFSSTKENHKFNTILSPLSYLNDEVINMLTFERVSTLSFVLVTWPAHIQILDVIILSLAE